MLLLYLWNPTVARFLCPRIIHHPPERHFAVICVTSRKTAKSNIARLSGLLALVRPTWDVWAVIRIRGENPGSRARRFSRYAAKLNYRFTLMKRACRLDLQTNRRWACLESRLQSITIITGGISSRHLSPSSHVIRVRNSIHAHRYSA